MSDDRSASPLNMTPCPQCGIDVHDRAVACPNCGTKIYVNSPADITPTRHPPGSSSDRSVQNRPDGQ
ncbi:zinc-ribbon domain-containing protein [Rhodopirellula sp. SM50]|nr:zinc-ribbon domain-containing protein [Rhodopirellula sp. SM50]